MSLPITVNAMGEVIDCQEAMQFQINKTQFACGFFACAMARSMVQPRSGQRPTLDQQQVITDALSWYARYDGSPAITNTDGMTLEHLYELLQQIGLHYQAVACTIDTARAWLAVGYPLIAAVPETSVYDRALGDVWPYPWHPSGTHIILLTGVTAEGHLLVRDSANCTNLYDPRSLRPGPRTYDAHKLLCVSLTVVVPPWLPRPTSAEAPAAPPVEATVQYQVPLGWSDDGTTLQAHGIPVRGAFRHYVLTHDWSPKDIPIGPEVETIQVELGYQQPDGNNAGLRQLFTYTELACTATRPPYIVSVGRELALALAAMSTPAHPAPTPENGG